MYLVECCLQGGKEHGVGSEDGGGGWGGGWAAGATQPLERTQQGSAVVRLSLLENARCLKEGSSGQNGDAS